MKQAVGIIVAIIMLTPALLLPARAQDEAGVREAMARWSAVYATATDASEMLALYHPDAVFWGTSGREPMAGAEAFAPYFQAQFDNYTDRHHEFLETVVRVIGDTATATGLYHFTVTPLSGSGPVDVTYRHSFAYLYVDGEWLVIQQHSSQLP